MTSRVFTFKYRLTLIVFANMYRETLSYHFTLCLFCKSSSKTPVAGWLKSDQISKGVLHIENDCYGNLSSEQYLMPIYKSLKLAACRNEYNEMKGSMWIDARSMRSS